MPATFPASQTSPLRPIDLPFLLTDVFGMAAQNASELRARILPIGIRKFNATEIATEGPTRS
jgi:hypothetical protein